MKEKTKATRDQIIAVVVAFVTVIGTAVGIWWGLGPETFWQRIFTIAVEIMVVVPLGVVTFFITIAFVSFVEDEKDKMENRK